MTVAHLLHLFQQNAQSFVEVAAFVGFLRALEIVLEAVGVEKLPKLVVHVVAEAVAATEWVGYDVECLAQVGGKHVTVGQVAGYLAQPVHIVAEGQQTGIRAG